MYTASAQQIGVLDKNFKPSSKFLAETFNHCSIRFIDAEDRIYVGGGSKSSDGYGPLKLMRFLPDGTLEKELTEISKDLESWPKLGRDGIIYAFKAEGESDYFWRRYSQDGKLDPSFQVATTSESDLFITKTGNIYITSVDEDNDVTTVNRYSVTGVLDKKFQSIQTRLIVDIRQISEDGIYVVEQDGYRGGYCRRRPAYAVKKYTADGRIDNTFQLFGAGFIIGLSFQSDGKLLVNQMNRQNYDCELYRYTPDGRIDDSFQAVISEDGFDFHVLKDDAIILAADEYISKLDPNGVEDPDFVGISFMDVKYPCIDAQSNGDVVFIARDEYRGATKYQFNRLTNSLAETNLLEKSRVGNSFSIFPNPVSSMLNIRKEGEASNSVDLVISDMSGKPVMSGNQKLIDGKLSIDMRQHPNGVYFVKVQDGGTSKQMKIIKQ